MLLPQPLRLFDEGALVALIKKPWIKRRDVGRWIFLRYEEEKKSLTSLFFSVVYILQDVSFGIGVW